MKKLLIILLLYSSNVLTHTWHDLLQEKSPLVSNKTLELLHKQCVAFKNSTAPCIADACIKSIKLAAAHQKLIDVRDMQHPRIIMMPNPPDNKPFSGPDYNSGLASASKMNNNVWHCLETMLPYLDSLAPHFGYLPGTITIHIFEALRDIKTQQQLFENKVQEIQSNNPALSLEEAEAQAAQWISPVKDNIPVHSTGAAVDIRLFNNETQDYIDCGLFGAIWCPNRQAPTFSEDISDAQKLHRLYLLLAATEAGLINYVYEFWHFSVEDKYAAYWQNS